MANFISKLFYLESFIPLDESKPLNDQAKIALLLRKVGDGVPMLSPVLISENSLKHGSRAFGCSYFPSTQKVSDYRKKFEVEFDCIKIIDSKNLLDNHKIKDIDAFDFGKVDRIQGFAREFGAITFRLQNLDSIFDCISNASDWMRMFKHLCVTKFYSNAKESPVKADDCKEDKLGMYITVIDLPLAIPIYNQRSIDGLAVMMGLYWPLSSLKLSGLYYSKEINFIVSNHTENVIHVDGAVINSPTTAPQLPHTLAIKSLFKSLEVEKVRQEGLKSNKTSKSK